MTNSVRTEWSCGCYDVWSFDRHEGMSWLCSKGAECVQKIAAGTRLVLFNEELPNNG